MIGDKQGITAGNCSTNIQGKEVHVVNNGLGYAEVKEVVMDVFKANFYELGEKANQIARERAEEILDEFLEKLNEVSPSLIEKTEDPDLQYAIFETQKSHARLGDNEISDLLVDVLIDRTINQEESFKKLVLNEALTVIPKLTINQIDILSLIYVFRYLSFLINIPFEHYYTFLRPFINTVSVPNDEMFYQHLQFCGCISISIGSSQAESIMERKIPGLNKDSIKEKYTQYPELTTFMNKWDATKLCNSSLTSVGLAIALSNIKRRTGATFDLDLWIKG